jgi:hypothetical protein
MGRYARCCPTLHSFKTTLLKLVKLGGVYAVMVETLLAKHQLIVMKRSQQRAKLSSLDRVVFGSLSLIIRPSTLLRFYQALSFSQENIPTAVLYTPVFKARPQRGHQ